MEKGKPVVLAAVEDMFFSAKIEAVARGMDVLLVEAANSLELAERLEELVPDLIIVDLNSRSCAPLDAIRRIRQDPRLADVPLVAFLSHVQVELEREARKAGCQNVLPRSKFSAELPRILRMSMSRISSDSGG